MHWTNIKPPSDVRSKRLRDLRGHAHTTLYQECKNNPKVNLKNNHTAKNIFLNIDYRKNI